MRLLSLRHDGNDTIAVRKDDGIYDLRVVAPDLPAALDLLMSSGTDWLARARKAAAQVTEAREAFGDGRNLSARVGAAGESLSASAAITRHMRARVARSL